MILLTCEECGANILGAGHESSCRQSWPKRRRVFLHATETWDGEPMRCEITRVVHQDRVWYTTPAGHTSVAYADFPSILGSWVS